MKLLSNFLVVLPLHLWSLFSNSIFNFLFFFFFDGMGRRGEEEGSRAIWGTLGEGIGKIWTFKEVFVVRRR
jgi:hypothetical protein